MTSISFESFFQAHGGPPEFGNPIDIEEGKPQGFVHRLIKSSVIEVPGPRKSFHVAFSEETGKHSAAETLEGAHELGAHDESDTSFFIWRRILGTDFFVCRQAELTANKHN